MLSLPQTLTVSTTVSNGESATLKGFGADEAGIAGIAGFADALRASAPAAAAKAPQAGSAGEALPADGKVLPSLQDALVTGPIKLPPQLPAEMQSAEFDFNNPEVGSVSQGLDLGRLVRRLAGGVQPVTVSAAAGEAAEAAVLPATIPTPDALAAPAAVPGALRQWHSEFFPGQRAGIKHGLTAAPVRLPAGTALPPSGPQQATVELPAPLAAITAAPVKNGAPQSPALAAVPLQEPLQMRQNFIDAQEVRAATRLTAAPVTVTPQATGSLQGAGTEHSVTTSPLTREPLAAGVTQQPAAGVVRPDPVAQILARGGAQVSPVITSTAQGAATMTAINDALQMAQPAPLQQQIPLTTTTQPRPDAGVALAVAATGRREQAPAAGPVRTVNSSSAAVAGAAPATSSVVTAATPLPAADMTVAAPVAPANTTVPAPVAMPETTVAVPTTPAAMKATVPATAVATAEAMAAELATSTPKSEVQPAAPSHTIFNAASAPALSAVAPAANPATALPPLNLPVTDSAWGDALSERVVVLAGQKLTSADIRLNPAELGPLRVEIKVEDGNTQIHFTAQHAVTREAIEQALPRLRELLSAEGLNLTGASVSEHGVRRDQGGQSESAGQQRAAASDSDLDDADLADVTTAKKPGAGLVDTFA